jgi:hypothetical protein
MALNSLDGLAQVDAKKSGDPDSVLSNLPVVLLETKEVITPDRERKAKCAVKIVGPQLDRRSNLGPLPGVVRIHGGVSQSYPKKSFALTLDAPAQLLDLREHSHWVLNAAYIDRSLMRHKLAYDLFRSLSTPNTARFAAASRFVEVYLNGSYNGAYLLMERVDRQLLQLRGFQSNDLAHSCIYKAVDHSANFGAPGHNGFEQREPDSAVLAYWKPLERFNRFVSSVSDAEFFDGGHGIGARLDLDNAIDFHLLVLLTCNLDGITKNFILARNGFASNSPPARFFFAPWDYDGTFGRNWDATPVLPTVWLSNHLFDRLLANRNYLERFAARWEQLRRKEFSVRTIQELIEANARALGDAAHRNAARWPVSTGGYPDQLSFSEDIAQMKQWADRRVKWLDQEILRLMSRTK